MNPPPTDVASPATAPVAAPDTAARDANAPRTTGRAHETLRPVLAVIPKHCYERPTARGVAYVARGVVIYLALLAALAFVSAWWLVIPLSILAGLAVSGLFVLGHDAAHGALFDSKRANRVVARWLMLPSLHVREAWVLGHNRIHHGHTLRQGMDFVWHPLTVDEYRALRPWQRWRHRFEWSQFGAGAYYMRDVWWNKMMTFAPPERYGDQIRRDKRFVIIGAVIATAAVATLGFLGVFAGPAGVAGAVLLVVKLLVVPFIVFNWSIGFTVHVHHIDPDVKWWPRRTWTSFAGQVEGTTVLHAPWLLNLFFYNIFVHVPHHVDVRIPFYALPEAADAIIAAYPDEVKVAKLRWRDYAATTRACKLYDFTEQRWLTYADATSS